MKSNRSYAARRAWLRGCQDNSFRPPRPAPGETEEQFTGRYHEWEEYRADIEQQLHELETDNLPEIR